MPPPHAAIDLSDGLVADLMHLLRASAVDANVEVEALLSPTLRDAAEELSVNALRFALTGGEDYALLVAAPNDWAAPADWAAASARDGNLRAKRIGTVSARDPALRLERGRAEPKLLLRKANGDLQEAADLLLELGLSSGFDHFR